MHDESKVSAAPEKYTVRSVERALGVVNVVAEGPHEGITLTELAKVVGASKSTVLAIVRTLVGAGYLAEVRPGPRYCLGTSLVRLGDIASQRLPLGDLSRPVLVSLAEETRMTARVAIEDNGYPIFIDRVDGPGSVRFYTPLGQREVPHASAAGKAILFTLTEQEVRQICGNNSSLAARTSHTITDIGTLLDNLAVARERGYAVDDEEDAEGIFCVGAPFYDHTGTCIGALSVTGIKGDLPSWRIDEIGHSVETHAQKITGILTGTSSGDNGSVDRESNGIK
ncbi:MAG: IclR family transcriptional regulator [Actinomycetota bacterium]|nr:IclR family transcriptional regulator [Actinomycetota bacterium]